MHISKAVIGILLLIILIPNNLLAKSNEWLIEENKNKDAFYVAQSGLKVADDELYFIHIKDKCQRSGMFFRLIAVPEKKEKIFLLVDKIIPIFVDDEYHEAKLVDIEPIIKANVSVAYYTTFYLGFSSNEKIIENFKNIEKILIQIVNPEETNKYDLNRENTLSGDFRIEQYFQKTQEIWDFSDFENAFKISIKRCQNISISSQVIGI